MFDIIDSPERLEKLKHSLNIVDKKINYNLSFSEAASLKFKEVWSLSQFAISSEKSKYRDLFYGSSEFKSASKERILSILKDVS